MVNFYKLSLSQKLSTGNNLPCSEQKGDYYMKLVFLDAKTIGDDLDLSQFDQFGEVVKYSFSTPEEVPGRVLDADVIIVNKILINEASIGTAKNNESHSR